MCLSISYISLKLILPLGNRNKTKTKGNVHGREREREEGVNQKRRDQEGDGEVGGEENKTEQNKKKVIGLDERSGFGKLGCRKTDDRSFVGKGRGEVEGGVLNV